MSGKPGMQKRVPLHDEQSRQRMWGCIRQLRRFTVADLIATAEAGTSHAVKYTRKLKQAGYLNIVQAKREGVPGGHAVYQLVRDTGPFAPRFGKQGALDPNIDPAHLPEDAKPVLVPRSDYERALKCVRACAGMQDPEAEVAALRTAASISPPPLEGGARGGVAR